ncbi:MAG: hypothetical protein ACRDRL_26385, partial [Sciscionella sp.]
HIRTLAGTLHPTAEGLTKSDISAADFGRAHTAHGAPFTQLLADLSRYIGYQRAAMDDYAARLEDSKGGYEFSEATNSSTVNKSGGGA